MNAPGRNDRCPCGSGRKHKSCCMGKAASPTTEAGRLALAHHAIERTLFDRMWRWSERRYGRDWFVDTFAAVLVAGEPPDPEEDQFFVPWVVHCLPHERLTPAAAFAKEEGWSIADAERGDLTCLVDQYVTIWEIRRVEPGVGLELHDRLC